MQAISSLKSKLYSFYKEHLSESALFANAGHLWTLKLSPLISGKSPCRYCTPGWKRDAGQVKNVSKIKLAVICDDMTWSSFQGECELIQLTPDGWYDQLESFRPDAFICESAWEGLRAEGSPWRWRIYRNHDLWFENRRELLDIIHYCHEAGIPTLFWNKEDPPAFDGKKYDFIDTALKFDHIFTTAEECIPLYTDEGHRSVHTLMFGFSPKIFHPMPYVEAESAVFHGSWYAIHPKRCEDMRQVFDTVLGMDMPLTIYDRQSDAGNPLAVFPDEYKPYVRPSVPYERIRETLTGQSYAVNINTVTGSATMFARRVFEMMACGLIVISNASAGIERLFGDRVWFAGRQFNTADRSRIRRENIVDVFLHHTWRQRIVSMLTAAGIEVSSDTAGLAVIYRSGSPDECRSHLVSLGAQGAEGWLCSDGIYTSLSDGRQTDISQFSDSADYFFTADKDTPFSELAFMTALTGFVRHDAAIAPGCGQFDYDSSAPSVNWLIPAALLEQAEKDSTREMPVYFI